ncbi:MAG: histidine kinase [Blastocatellia bacterium]|nr:histidine kinase [Blastocatellia bacterium]
MSLRLKFLAYLFAMHLLLAAVGAFLIAHHRWWLLVVELAVVCSAVIGVRLVGQVFGTLDLLGTGAEFIKERDFSARFLEVGQPEMDQLVAIYNQMIDNLREERLKLQEQHYLLDKIITASPSGIVTFDFDERISGVNPAAERLLALSQTDLLAHHLDELQSPLAAPLKGLHPGESCVTALPGGRRVKCFKSEFLDRGFPRTFLLLEELTEELRQSEKAAYEKLIRMMSHEVNNSIGAANSLLNSCLLYKEHIAADDRDDFENALRVVITRTEQLSAFMKRFADVVRVPKPKKSPCDLPELVNSVADLLRAECERREITLSLEFETGVPAIALDRILMEQALINIFKNACEAIGSKGRIRCVASLREQRPVLAIEDSGSGFDSGTQLQLFTPFFTTKDHGQGIGLTLVREILEAHDCGFSLERLSDVTRFEIVFQPNIL